MKESRLRAVPFDRDGVLLDPEQFIRKAGIEMFREKGYTAGPEDLRQFKGMGENHYPDGVAESNDIPYGLGKDKARTYGIYAGRVKDKLSLLPGVRDFIGECQSRGLRTDLVSGTDRIVLTLSGAGIEVLQC
jgi:beta-phosphoglucomutase-like phosphatase (HAD superfamily)